MCVSDIQEKNIILSLDDTEAFQAYEEREQTSPVARNIDGDRIIYLSRPIEPKQYGPP